MVKEGHNLLRPLESWSKDSVALLTGLEGVYALAHLWITHLGLLGFKVHVIDCSIRFNVFRLVEECLSEDTDPEALLRKVIIQRSFTPYQILTTVRRIEDGLYPNRLFVFLAPCKQFFDGDVSEEEGRFLLHMLVRKIESLKGKHPILLVDKPGYGSPVFDEVFPRFVHICEPVWRVNLLPQATRKKSSPATKGHGHWGRSLNNQSSAISQEDVYGQNRLALFPAN